MIDFEYFLGQLFALVREVKFTYFATILARIVARCRAPRKAGKDNELKIEFDATIKKN